jgi:hypothetical protein
MLFLPAEPLSEVSMRVLRYGLMLAAMVTVGCQSNDLITSSISAPTDLTYELSPSGVAGQPASIRLSWSSVPDPSLSRYRVYSSATFNGSFGLRGETTSNTFDDNGVPNAQYYVTAVDAAGAESDPSNVITVNEALQLQAPASLSSISLNGAIELSWSDNAYLTDPADFKWYRVYSTGYDLDHGLCGATWSLEGTTVSPEFLAGALVNGVPRCYGVSAISVNGYESLWSPLRQDTPRPDARNVLVWAYQADSTQAGFRFWDDLNADGTAQPAELGLIQNGNRTDIDFWVYRDAGDTLWLVPESTGTSMRLYSNSPIGDLTDIDIAPASGYTRNMFQAVPGYGYVFQIVDGATLHYGALRVTHVSRNYVIFDWSVQTDPGNPELLLRGGQPTTLESGMTVTGAQ